MYEVWVLKMVDDKNNYMGSYREKVSKSVSGFGRKNLSAVLIIAFGVLMMAGYGASQVSSGYDVSIGQNGIEMGTGTLDVMGNDIVSSGTTIWDASAGEVPSGVVGLNLSNSAGDFMDYNSSSDELDVDGASIQSGTTASDVGLGNVENTAALNESGDTLGGNLNLASNIITGPNGLEITGFRDIGKGGDSYTEPLILESSGAVLARPNKLTTVAFKPDGSTRFYGNINMYDEDINNVGTLNANTKNFVQSINSSYNAVYTSQESPMPRAVIEGEAHIVDSKRIELPRHFTQVVSDSKPELRVQVSPRGTFTKAVPMEATQEYIEIKVGKETDVNFRITGIREGYEDKEVVRPKEEK